MIMARIQENEYQELKGFLLKLSHSDLNTLSYLWPKRGYGLSIFREEVRRRTCEFKERKECERQAEEQQLLNLEFAEWRRELSESELLKILPEFARNPGPIQNAALKSHFETEVWPSLSAGGFGELDSERRQIQDIISESLGEAKT